MLARRLYFVGNVLLVLTLVGVMALVLWSFPRATYEATLAESGADSEPVEALMETAIEQQRGAISPWLLLPAALAVIAVMAVGRRKIAPEPLSAGTKRLLLFLALGAVALLVVVFCVWLLSFLLSMLTYEPLIGATGGGGGSSQGGGGGEPVETFQEPPTEESGAEATLTVVNDTGTPICQVYISPVTSQLWEANWLSASDTVLPGEIRTFDVPVGDYDLLATDCDGNELDIAWGVDLSGDFTWMTSGTGGSTGWPTEVPEATRTPAAPPPPVLEPNVIIEAEWPVKMAVGTSDSIRVSLIRVAEDEYVATVEVEGRTVIGATPLPVGTPEAPIERAFGPDYEASVTANLVSTAFEIEPVTNARQPLDQNVIIWEWNIISDRPGEQTVNARIEAEWVPTGGEGAAIQSQIWLSRFDILVYKPLITTGQVSVMSLVTGFIGSGLSLPWLFEQVREAVKERKKTEDKEEAGEEGTSGKVPPSAARPPDKVEKPAKKH
jgi:hypothetical protein